MRALNSVANVLPLLALTALAGDDARWTGSALDYKRAGQIRALTRNTVVKDKVVAHWQPDNLRFWYRNDLSEGRHEFILVDAGKGLRAPAFDHARLAGALQKAGVKNADTERLPVESLEFRGSSQLTLRAGGKIFDCDLATYTLVPRTEQLAPAPEKSLPPAAAVRASRQSKIDTTVLFVNQTTQDVNLAWVDTRMQRHSYGVLKPGEKLSQSTYAGHVWLATDLAGKTVGVFEAGDVPGTATIDGNLNSVAKAEAVKPKTKKGASPDGKWLAFIKENNLWLGSADKDDAAALTHDGATGDAYGAIFWSPDSSHLVSIRTRAGEEHLVHVVESSPKDQVQPKLRSYNYPKPGDRVAVETPHLFEAASRKEIPVSSVLFANPWDLSEYHWEPDSKRFTFLFNARGHQALRVLAIDAQSGAVESIIKEESKTFVDYSSKFFLRRLDAAREILWMSERDGWNHLYLYDALSGRVKHQVTRGEWVVRRVERVDEAKRQVYFTACGIYPEQDPYYVHYCRVNFDGSGLVRLTDGDGTHSISYSPDERFLIDTFSRVDLPPVTELRRAEDGKRVCALESADASALLAKGWRPPERFVAKGRDGATDIHGVIVRPLDFDPQHKYPVIEHIYAGPQDSYVPKAWSVRTGTLELAELGFIVVQIDGMGTSNRSKAFHDVCWMNLADAGFPDRILWMKAAAAKYPYMDLSRVGIYGGSAGGQNALGAVLFHPEFYTAAAADCGCHDNRMDKIWWNEQWMGWPVGKHYDEQSNVTNAYRLKGKLLLTVGELDSNVDPASTMQVVNALIKADKDFEFLIVPGANHGIGESPYASRRRKDFFVRSLLRAEPRH